MEIGISRKGELQILSVKGRIHLQNWRVLDKHLETMLRNGVRWLAMDLSEVTLICSTGVGAVMHNVRKFRDRDASLMLVAESAYIQELFQIFGCEPIMGGSVFNDWGALEKRLNSQGLALTSP
jgi:anti-anti-sigma factor